MRDFWIALSVVSAVGLLAGILLAVVSRFFHVEEDERVKTLRACLPGVNCGACGFTGCDDYAAALAAGNAPPNLCVPGGAAVAGELGKILGVEAEQTEPMVAFVLCNGREGATGRKAKYSGIESCRAAAMLYGGPADCRFGCLGFGDCEAVCPAGAIRVRDGVAQVDPSLCVGCGLCARTCPKRLIRMIPRRSRVVVRCSNMDKGAAARKACLNACIGCGKCRNACPEGAISLVDNLARIDYGACTGCGACAEVCPTHCLVSVPVSRGIDPEP